MTIINTYTQLNNLYCSILQRTIDESGFNNYKHMDINDVKTSLLMSEEYHKLNLKKLNKKSPHVSIPYAIISINDRAAENTKRTKNIISSQFINDITYEDMHKSDISSYYLKNNIKITWNESLWKRKPLDGELANLASHINCLKYMIDNDIPELIVLEDDAILVEDFMDKLSNCYNDLPEDYDFLVNTGQINVGAHFAMVDMPVLIGSDFIYKSYLLDSVTMFVLYSNKGARKILDALDAFGMYEPTDWFLYDLSRNKILNGYSTFFNNTLLEPKNLFGSLIDPTEVRITNPIEPEQITNLSIIYENILDKKISYKIPNIIHQTWKSKTDIPENFLAWRNSFIESNPNFSIELYDDTDNRNFISKHLPQLLPIYDNFPREIYRVDFVRAVYLFFYGGIYADMDVQCLTSLKRYLNLSGVHLARMGTSESFEHSIPNAIMASSKNCAFWIFYISKMVEIFENSTLESFPAPEYSTGPVILRDSFLSFNSNVKCSIETIHKFINKFDLSLNLMEMDFSLVNIMESNIWFPLDWNNNENKEIRKKVLSNEIFPNKQEATLMFPDSEMVTYWTHTWE